MGINLTTDQETLKRERRGGFGRVWKVKLKSTNDYFAAKVMSKAKIIAKRSEENIIDNENLYLLMDLLSGGDLRYHISHKKPCVFNEIQTKFFISNIIIALEYIHSQKIIHRDVKPENLVLDKNGYVRLTDFGIAVINKDENSKESSGTAGYMAPEVMLQQGYSYSADFFALGVIGYEFMIGHRPYYGRNRKQIKDFIMSYQAKIQFNNMKKGWSENSKDFINKLLQRRPVKRLGYNGIKELKNHAWLKDIDWISLKNRRIRAPYIPKEGKDFYDKKYCEEEKTIEKYKNVTNIESYQHIFENYTFINMNYIYRLKNINNSSMTNNTNEFDLSNIIQSSFSESLTKGHNFLSSKNVRNFNLKNNLTSKLSKSVKKDFNPRILNRNLSSSQSKDFRYNSSNQLKKFYNIGIPKDKEKVKEKIENNDNNNKNGRKIINKPCFSSKNLKKEKTQIIIKDIHELVEKSLKNTPNKNDKKVISRKAIKQKKGFINSQSFNNPKSNFSKSRTYKNILEKKNIDNEKKITINIDKEKEMLINSTTKEKTTKEKTTDNRDKNINIIKKISKKTKTNYNKGKEKEKALKKEESKYSINGHNNRYKKESYNIKKDSFFQSQYSVNENNKNSLFHSRNNRLNPKMLTNTKEMNNNNESDYQIRVIHRKIYKFDYIKYMYNSHKDKNNKYLMNKNISMFKNNSISKNYETINSLSNKKKRFYNSTKKTRKDNRHKNRFYNSKGFNEFRKKNTKNLKSKPNQHKPLSNENLIINKENKEKKKNDCNQNNNNANPNGNGDDKIKVLKFEDYFRNTGLDKESTKNNYYILDKYVSI